MHACGHDHPSILVLARRAGPRGPPRHRHRRRCLRAAPFRPTPRVRSFRLPLLSQWPAGLEASAVQIEVVCARPQTRCGSARRTGHAPPQPAAQCRSAPACACQLSGMPHAGCSVAAAHRPAHLACGWAGCMHAQPQPLTVYTDASKPSKKSCQLLAKDLQCQASAAQPAQLFSLPSDPNSFTRCRGVT